MKEDIQNQSLRSGSAALQCPVASPPLSPSQQKWQWNLAQMDQSGNQDSEFVSLQLVKI